MDFSDRVLAECKKIPRGKVTTYKLLAERLGSKAYRTVGTILSNNKYPIIIPCHRVIKSNLEVGNYSGSGGVKKKIELLRREGVVIEKGKVKKEYLHH